MSLQMIVFRNTMALTNYPINQIDRRGCTSNNKGKSRLISRLENTGTMDSSTYTNLRLCMDQAVPYTQAMFTDVWSTGGHTGH